MSLFVKLWCYSLIFGFMLVIGASCSSPQSDLITAGDLAAGQLESAEAKSRKKRKPSAAASSKRQSRSKSKGRKVKVKKKTKKKKIVNVLDLPSVRKLRRSQAKRLNKVDYYKRQFLIGETDEGLLGIRPAARMPASSKTEVLKLVQAENRDRERLYKIVVKKERYNKKEEKILREQFFESFRVWDPRGAYFSVDRAWQN